jgi:hypothetical protein
LTIRNNVVGALCQTTGINLFDLHNGDVQLQISSLSDNTERNFCFNSDRMIKTV